MELTVSLPDDLAARLLPLQEEIPQLLERALNDRDLAPQEYQDVVHVLKVLAVQPSDQEILALRPSAFLQARVRELLAKNRTAALSPEEEREWQRYEQLNDVVSLAKAHAAARHKSIAGP